MAIHPTAVVDAGAEIDSSAEIGPYAIIEGGVRIGPECRLAAHTFIGAGTTLTARVDVHPFAVVGHIPQDLAFSGEPSFTEVGPDTIIREHASIHRGTVPGSTTVIGARCFLMSTVHVAHNCRIEDDVKIATGAMLGGHVSVGRGTFLGGNSGAHQFVRIGAYVMLGGNVATVSDIPPFMMATLAGVVGLNIVGLRRNGFSREARAELQQAHRLLYRSGLHFPAALAKLRDAVKTDAGRELLAFVEVESKRGYLRGPARRRARADEPEQDGE
jgi:UDP-N-acetylglucosamine acyltransferase